MKYRLKITLESDTTFGRGDGVAGLVDTEVEYDVQTGLPFVRGRVLRGLLVEECSNILYSLQQQGSPRLEGALLAARRLFGIPGSTTTDSGLLFVGAATLPLKLQLAVAEQIQRHNVSTGQILESLTTLRRQTAIDEDGVPKRNSLRTERAVLRKLVLNSELSLSDEPEGLDEPLLAACVLCLRRGGLGRNRGRGKLMSELWHDDVQVMPTLLFTEDTK